MTKNGRNAHKNVYRSDHDCFGNPTLTPDGYPIEDEPEAVPEPDEEERE